MLIRLASSAWLTPVYDSAILIICSVVTAIPPYNVSIQHPMRVVKRILKKFRKILTKRLTTYSVCCIL
nr:MAG TPA: hypothetical protein [Caudoviricetes sp.]